MIIKDGSLISPGFSHFCGSKKFIDCNADKPVSFGAYNGTVVCCNTDNCNIHTPSSSSQKALSINILLSVSAIIMSILIKY